MNPLETVMFRWQAARRPRFQSYEAALARCDGYGADELAEVAVTKTRQYPRNILRFIDVRLLYVLHQMHKESLTVIDFGGAAGEAYFLAREMTTLKLHWTVVETPTMVKHASVLSNDELRFVSSLESALLPDDEVDLVIASSVLQYVPQPYETLAELIRCRAETLYLTRTSLTEERGFVTIERSRLSAHGPGTLALSPDPVVGVPHTVMERSRIEAILRESYEEVVTIEEVPHFMGPNFKVIGYLAQHPTEKPGTSMEGRSV